eukprot:CFRG2050T1
MSIPPSSQTELEVLPHDHIVKQILVVNRKEDVVDLSVYGFSTIRRKDIKPHPTNLDLEPLGILLRLYLQNGAQTKSYPKHYLYYNYFRLKHLLGEIDSFNQWWKSLSKEECAGLISIQDASINSIKYYKYRTRILDVLRVAGIKMPRLGTDDPEGHRIRIDGLAQIIEWIEVEYKDQLAANDEFISRGEINMDSVAKLLAPGNIVCTVPDMQGGEYVAVEVVTSHFEEHKTLFGVTRSFRLVVAFVASVGDKFAYVQYDDVISPFLSTKRIVDFVYRPLTEGLRKELSTRGARYAKFALQNKYVAYKKEGFFVHPERKGYQTTIKHLKGDGRVMLDTLRGYEYKHTSSVGGDGPSMALQYTMGKAQQLRRRTNNSGEKIDVRNGDDADFLMLPALNEYEMLLTWPSITGFSMNGKVWGHVLVDSLSEIVFDSASFDKLVLPEAQKELIQALVVHSSSVFTDIVKGKGGGSVFLLHGPPGVGKTLTAEALAECLQKPLYVASMGELGTSAVDLEQRLDATLNLCGQWDAIVLLDEADVFLEKREKSEVLRNAMVCVMLRLLEYHDGVIFLTSNRVNYLDPAVQSRVTLALAYHPLNYQSREKIWRLLVSESGIMGITDEMYSLLAETVINGRQIKNSVKLAQALAQFRNTQTTMEHLRLTVGMQMDFADSTGNNEDTW